MNLETYLQEKRQLVDEALDRWFPPESATPCVLSKAMRYSALDGGKRIRPVLTLAAAEAVGGRVEDALPAACAIEMIHAFSLIHDDLPCMDNDDFRRGKPTSHKVFGEAVALLAGDALLALAFETVARTPPSVPASSVLEVSLLIARGTGSEGMIGGQTLDMEGEGKTKALPDVERIHRKKTGALLEASVLAGGILGGADEAQRESLSRYGRKAGLAFQIVDDILDLLGDEEKLGKKVGSDLDRDKATYPSIVGLDESRRMATDAVNAAIDALSSFGEAAEPLRLIARLIIDRDR